MKTENIITKLKDQMRYDHHAQDGAWNAAVMACIDTAREYGWQPIDTVPTDGSLFDLWVVSEFTDGQESSGRRVPDVSYWADQFIKGVPDEYNEAAIEEFSNGKENATHWMHRPDAPANRT